MPILLQTSPFPIFLDGTLLKSLVYTHAYTFIHSISYMHENITMEPIIMYNSYILIKKTNKKIEPVWAT